MIGLVVAIAAVTVGSIVVLTIVLTRFVRLQRAVGAINERLGNDNGGAPALFRRVSELRRRLDAAELDASRLRTAVEKTDLGIIIADRTGVIVYANPAADRVLQGREGDVVARGRVLQLVGRVTRSGTEEELEFDLYTPVRRILMLRAVPLDSADGRDHAALVYILDLTDRHRLEAMRRDFVANAGHELKTPLGALSVLAETLADAEESDVRNRLADRLASEANRMAKLVDDILQLAAIESLETPHTPVVIADVLREAEAAVLIRAEEQGVSIVGKLPGDDVVVSGDQKQLTSAVGNLLDNGVTHTPSDRGGTVWYRAWQEGGWVFIEVEDHGIGVAEQHRERIFERFYRVDRARSRASGGTGLGLSIVRNVARTHGGEVTVRSELGIGSTFTVKLPVSKEP